MSGYGPGIPILPAPASLKLGDDADDWRPWRHQQRPVRSQRPDFPKLIPIDDDLFACSGGLDSQQFREASKFRRLPEMTWEEARVALARLHAPIRYRYDGQTGSREHVALASFALAASGFTGFDANGRRGEHAVKLRDGLADAEAALHGYLQRRLDVADDAEKRLARPLPQHVETMADDASVRRLSDTAARVLDTWLPAAGDWLRLHKATAEQAMAALGSLRETLVIWQPRRPSAERVAERLLSINDLPSAADYAEAVHVADMLIWTGETLLAAYSGCMIAMPMYRLHPTLSEAEAFALWWPWGQPTPLTDGRPSPPPKPRKVVLDPTLITATRPQDIVREVMQKTGLNRTTAQRLTAAKRAAMRAQRQYEARGLLFQGLTKAEVARRVGLSPSRLSAMFKGDEEIARHKAVRAELVAAGIEVDDLI